MAAPQWTLQEIMDAINGKRADVPEWVLNSFRGMIAQRERGEHATWGGH